MMNIWGDVIYGTDLGTTIDPTTFFGEGVFLRRAGAELELARGTSNGVCANPCPSLAPGGGLFDFLLMGQAALNDDGDAAFVFSLFPVGSTPLNGGVYRYSRKNGAVTAVMTPGKTTIPGGGTFVGAGFNVRLNNRGDLVFTGLAPTTHPGPLPFGVYKADAAGMISSVVRPGDAAPGGGSFDSVYDGFVNNFGDVVFDAHLAAETGPEKIGRASLYFKNARTGQIESIAHAGDPAPGGGVFRSVYSPVLNDQGDIAFLGDLSPGAPTLDFEKLGVYLYSGNKIVNIAKPGDHMKGGGRFVTASFITAENLHINNTGEVVFNAKLDTDDNKDGLPDTGLYMWSHGSPRLVARTGTVIPGEGMITQLAWSAFISFPVTASYVPNSGAINNDRGQVLFGATLSDGKGGFPGLLLQATPLGGNDEDEQ